MNVRRIINRLQTIENKFVELFEVLKEECPEYIKDIEEFQKGIEGSVSKIDIKKLNLKLEEMFEKMKNNEKIILKKYVRKRK